MAGSNGRARDDVSEAAKAARESLLWGEWTPLQPSRPGATDSVVRCLAPRRAQFLGVDFSVTTADLPIGDTAVNGCVALRFRLAEPHVFVPVSMLRGVSEYFDLIHGGGPAQARKLQETEARLLEQVAEVAARMGFDG